MVARTFQTVADEAELREILGTPHEQAANKDRFALEPHHIEWLAHSPFCLVATSGRDGACDVSPKGDPPGFTLVLDEHTIAIPERPGNKRGDGFRNILANPHVGLVYLIPGRTDTLRINGRAQIVRDADFFDELAVRGHRPVLAIVVEIEQIFYHCAKAFLRSRLWAPETWTPEALPTRAEIVHRFERPHEPVELIEQYYAAAYEQGLYKEL